MTELTYSPNAMRTQKEIKNLLARQKEIEGEIEDLEEEIGILEDENNDAEEKIYLLEKRLALELGEDYETMKDEEREAEAQASLEAYRIREFRRKYPKLPLTQYWTADEQSSPH